MTRNLTIAERLISTVLILWGGITLYTLIRWIAALREMELIPYMSVTRFIVQYHLLLLLPLLTIVAGMLLLFNKKTGWTLSLIVLLSEALLILIPAGRRKSVFTDATTALVFSSIAFLSLALFCILALPAFRQKYTPTKATWWTVGLITVLLLVDKTLLYFLSE